MRWAFAPIDHSTSSREDAVVRVAQQHIRESPTETGGNNIIKYESSLERSIFRNLAILKFLLKKRPTPENTDDDVLELQV
jgi:hypothetical protein